MGAPTLPPRPSRYAYLSCLQNIPMTWTVSQVVFGVMMVIKGMSYALNNPAKEILYQASPGPAYLLALLLPPHHSTPVVPWRILAFFNGKGSQFQNKSSSRHYLVPMAMTYLLSNQLTGVDSVFFNSTAYML